MNYFYKYRKYKTKYNNLKNKLSKNFYFVHSTPTFDNLIHILQDGILYPGKNVEPERRIYSGGLPKDFIFANIYFGDINYLSHLRDFSLI